MKKFMEKLHHVTILHNGECFVSGGILAPSFKSALNRFVASEPWLLSRYGLRGSDFIDGRRTQLGDGKRFSCRVHGFSAWVMA